MNLSELQMIGAAGGQRRLTPSGVLARLGIGALVLAQFLPAYSAQPWSEVQHVLGLTVTTTGWAGAMLGGEPVLLLGWTANLWLAAMLLVGLTRHVRLAQVLAGITEVTALIGAWALATFDTMEQVTGLEVGAWVWLLGMTLSVGAVALSTREADRGRAVQRHLLQKGLVGAVGGAVTALALLGPRPGDVDGVGWVIPILILGGMAMVAIIAFSTYPVWRTDCAIQPIER